MLGSPRRRLAVSAALLLLLGGLLGVPPARAAQASWTVLVYLDADNNLEDEGVADFNQMEEAPDSTQVNVIVQFDRPSHAGSPTSQTWSGARRYKVTHDTNLQTIHSTQIGANLGPTNMGDPRTLQDFVEWGIQSYPANHYALILWDHGSGWRAESVGPTAKAICQDDTSSSRMSMAQLQVALANIDTSLGRNLDLVACDACIMGELEVAYGLESPTTHTPLADYYVASETNVPDAGLPYNDFLTELVTTPAMSAHDLCQVMVNTYRASYNGGDQGFEWVTLSALDLSRMSGVATALSAFADQLQNTADAVSTYGDNLHTWWELSQVWGTDGDDQGQVDLAYFTDLVRADAPNDALPHGRRKSPGHAAEHDHRGWPRLASTPRSIAA